MKKALKIVGSALFYGTLILAIVAAVFFSLNTDERKSLFGYRFYEVLSGSMRPTIDIGELVVIKMVDPDDVAVGDIVTKSVSSGGSVTVTHRVIERYTDEEGRAMVVTQGDNNDVPDEAIPVDAIIGIVTTHIPYVGHVVGFVKGNLIFVIFMCAGLIVISALLPRVFKRPSQAAPEDPDELEKQAMDLLIQAEELIGRAAELREASNTVDRNTVAQCGDSCLTKGKRGGRPMVQNE